MSTKSKQELIEQSRKRYLRLNGKTERGKYLTQFCDMSGYDRSYAQKVLSGKRSGTGVGRKSRSGRKRKYSEEDKQILKEIWLMCDQPCGARLKAVLPIWLESYSRNKKRLRPAQRERISAMSSSNIDRYISEYKVKGVAKQEWRKGRSKSALKAIIPIRAESWNSTEAGWLKVDCVALCGGDMSQDFVWILTAAGVWSGWTEIRPMWNRSAKNVIKHYEEMRDKTPFKWRGVDSDNGGEFISIESIKWQRMRAIMGERIELTRSRPYLKNDQAYVEQKNYTHVRDFFGYDRYAHQQIIEAVQEVSEPWSLYNNLYRPIMKQLSSCREGSRRIRRHEKEAKSPAQRIIEARETKNSIRRALRAALRKNDPWLLRQECERGLKHIWSMIHILSERKYSELEKDTLANNFARISRILLEKRDISVII